MDQGSDNDPAILYIIIGKFARSTKPTVPEHDAVQKDKEEKKVEQKVEQKVLQSNKSTICDVKACSQHMNITEIKEVVLQQILGLDKNKIQISDLDKALLKFKIQGEGMESC